MDVLFFDFPNTLDTVPRSRLLYKLKSYGIYGPVLRWISAFLLGWEMCARVGSSLSFRQLVLIGVPQRSVIGLEELGVPSLMFANDLKLAHNRRCDWHTDPA